MLPEAHSTANFAHYFLPLSTLRFPCKCRIRGCKVRGGGLECRFQNQHLRIQPDSDTNSLTTLKSKLFTYKILLKIHSPQGDHRLIYETRVAQIKKQHKNQAWNKHSLLMVIFSDSICALLLPNTM